MASGFREIYTMLTRSTCAAAVMLAVGALLGWLAATGELPSLLQAQQPAGSEQPAAQPGSPAATTAVDGKRLPPADPKFGGKIEKTADKSTPYWPPRVTPKKGAPNVLLIMTDDSGFGVTSTFGGVIPTP